MSSVSEHVNLYPAQEGKTRGDSGQSRTDNIFSFWLDTEKTECMTIKYSAY